MGAQRLVVIGGDAAGMSAASQARKRRSPDELAIVAFERGRYTSYSACGIPYWISGAVEDMDKLVSRTPEKHRDNGIDMRTRTEVVGIDVAARTVRARDLNTGREYDEPYDDLVYATGSVPARPPVPGIDAAGVYGVQTLDDGAALRAELDGGHVQHVVIVGGGYIGLEVAEACQVRGLDVTVVDRSATPVGTFDPDVGEFIADAVRDMGVKLVMSDGVAEIETGADGQAVAVHTASGRRLPADLVVLGLGVRPNVVLALGTHANKQGRVAGINLGGGYATFPGVIGTAITKICSLEVARTGLSEREADEAGYRFVTAVVDSTTKAGYFPGAAQIRLKLIAEQRTGRLLGAQIVGREDAAKRIDVLATAIWNEMDVDEVLSLDLSYAPPFSPVWDPVLIAARKAFDAVEVGER